MEDGRGWGRGDECRRAERITDREPKRREREEEIEGARRGSDREGVVGSGEKGKKRIEEEETEADNKKETEIRRERVGRKQSELRPPCVQNNTWTSLAFLIHNA